MPSFNFLIILNYYTILMGSVNLKVDSDMIFIRYITILFQYTVIYIY